MKRTPWVIVEILVALVAGYLVLVAATALFQRSMIYHPGRTRPEPAAVGLPEMVSLQVSSADGWLVTGWYAPPTKPDRVTIVFYHGNSGTIADRAAKARRLLDAGHGVLLAGYRGFGGNPGNPTEAGLVMDGRAALHWLIGKGIPQSRIVLYGESLGTGIVTRLAGELEDLAGVILEAPFTCLPDLAPSYLLPGLARLLMADRFDNRVQIGAVTAPLLLLHGELDDLVPASMGKEILGRAQSAREKHGLFLPETGHNDIWDKGGADAVMEFLAELTRW
ncbi:alpha/beta hydrolase [Magnetospirillum moscoviense]|uniref:Alpha/beta hydrolase n=1 Tax=Magnetospirillum moscoviense TaxID=1437059 RepID=A0A178MUV4_9PROT|nr:alpha/beta hydrolase [Magnetospirillum moscoviense]